MRKVAAHIATGEATPKSAQVRPSGENRNPPAHPLNFGLRRSDEQEAECLHSSWQVECRSFSPS